MNKEELKQVFQKALFRTGYEMGYIQSFIEQIGCELVVLQYKEDEINFHFENSKTKGKWSHLKDDILNIYVKGKRLPEAIEYVIDNSKDKVIKQTLIKNGNNKKKLIENLRRSLTR